MCICERRFCPRASKLLRLNEYSSYTRAFACVCTYISDQASSGTGGRSHARIHVPDSRYVVKRSYGSRSLKPHTAARNAMVLAPSRGAKLRKVMMSLTFPASKCFVPRSAGCVDPGFRSKVIRLSVM